MTLRGLWKRVKGYVVDGTKLYEWDECTAGVLSTNSICISSIRKKIIGPDE